MKLAIGCAALVLLVGCTPDPGQPTAPATSTSPTTSTPAPSPSPSATPTPSPTAVSSYPSDLPTGDSEEAAIIAGWQEYWRVLDKYAADPRGYTDFTETQLITRGTASQIILNEIQSLRDRDAYARGGVRFTDVVVGDIEAVDELRRVEMTYCRVIKDIDVRHAYNDEPYERDIPPTLKETATLEEGPDGVWRMFDIKNKAQDC